MTDSNLKYLRELSPKSTELDLLGIDNDELDLLSSEELEERANEARRELGIEIEEKKEVTSCLNFFKNLVSKFFSK